MSAAMPWDKWFWTDYEADPGLRMSSLAAQGLWMRMLCLMAKATPKGDLRVGGEPCTVADLAMYVGQPEETVAALLEELSRRGVYSTTRTGVIFNRRMRKSAIISRKRSEAGAKGAAATNGKQKGIPVLPQQKPGKPPGKKAAPEARSQNTLPNGNAAEAANLAEKLWSEGLAVLLAANVPEAKARTMLGKWRKSLGDAGTLTALVQCQVSAISDPVGFVEKIVRNGNGRHRETEHERQERERREWLAATYGTASSERQQA